MMTSDKIEILKSPQRRENQKNIVFLSRGKIDISVVIPCLNESRRLPLFLQQLISHCASSRYNYEIIVVDDGSSDKTAEKVAEYQAVTSNLTLIRFQINQGKGEAVRQGFFVAQGEYVIFMDADGSTQADEIEKNICYFDEGYDVVVGSRVLKDSERKVESLWYRKAIGAVFNTIVRLVLFSNIKDTQCGFKMFRKALVKPLYSVMTIKRFGFDLEILYIAHKKGYRIKEVPVNWRNVDESKINLLTDSLRMFINIFQIRFRHLGSSNKDKKMFN